MRLIALFLAISLLLPAYKDSAAARRDPNIFADECSRLLATGAKLTKEFRFLAETYYDDFNGIKSQFFRFLDENNVKPSDLLDIEYLGNLVTKWSYDYIFSATLTSGKILKIQISKSNFRPEPFEEPGEKILKPLPDVGLAINRAARQANIGREILRKPLEKFFDLEGVNYSEIAALSFRSIKQSEPPMFAIEVQMTDGRIFTYEVRKNGLSNSSPWFQ
jgi:hypothetical protein